MSRNISYSPFHRWYKPVIAEPENLFSQKNKKRILSTLKRMTEEEICFSIKPLDESFLTWFEPRYQKVISSKQNPHIHDIKSKTLENLQSESEYFSLTITQKDINVGGIIFGVRTDSVMIAYKIFDNNWIQGTLQASPTLLAEYVICQHAYELKKEQISHGKDRNPYGINASIGLANYKLSVGYQAFISEEMDVVPENFLVPEQIKNDILILHYPKEGKKITDASLFTRDDNKDKYAQILSYPKQLKIDLVT